MVGELVQRGPQISEADWEQRLASLSAEANQLYDTVVRPMEKDHFGTYVVVSPDGRAVHGRTVDEAMQRGREAFGHGNYVFRVGGDGAVWRVR